MKVLVVEDEIRIREGIGRLLARQNSGYELAGEAENGQQGYEMVCCQQPDIIITDIRMPIMDGLEMLEKIYADGYTPKAIVLSAYSEFEYARQALKLGVTEYLLKPINLSDFSKALANARMQVEKERMRQPEEMGTLEQIISGLLWGGLVADVAVQSYVEQKYKIGPETAMLDICVYLGRDYEQHLGRARRQLELLLSQRPDISWCLLEAPYEKSIYIVLYGVKQINSVERWFQYEILSDRFTSEGRAGVGCIQSRGIAGIREAFETLAPYMDWNIALGEDVMISYPKITKVQNIPCTYPVELENQLKVAICTMEPEKVSRYVAQFHKYFLGGRIFAPKEIKECYVRFLWSLINIAKEVGSLDYQKLEQQKLLEAIMNARTRKELKAAADGLLDKLKFHQGTEDEVVHLTVKRAKSMIHEFYQTGITLNEIADKLDITPEYLGSQFHKEVGVNFSTYIRDFRISKAKELLIGTPLKLYEIAEQVGYTDPKYFSRVFKECTGQLPADYRKAHK